MKHLNPESARFQEQVFHFILTPKYRHPILVDQVALRLGQLIVEDCARLNVEILASAIMPDHVHLFLSLPRGLSTSQVAHQIKGHSSFVLRREFPALAAHSALWGKTFMAYTVGGGRRAVRTYIEKQGLS